MCYISINTAESVSLHVTFHKSAVYESKTESTTSLFPTQTEEGNTTAIITGGVAMVATLLVLCVSACLVFMLRCRSRKISRRIIEQENNNRRDENKDFIGHRNNCLNDKYGYDDEGCEKMHCTESQSKANGDYSTPEYELRKTEPCHDRGSTVPALRGNTDKMNDTIEKKDCNDCCSDSSLELACYEPAYCNVEGHFIELNQAF